MRSHFTLSVPANPKWSGSIQVRVPFLDSRRTILSSPFLSLNRWDSRRSNLTPASSTASELFRQLLAFLDETGRRDYCPRNLWLYREHRRMIPTPFLFLASSFQMEPCMKIRPAFSPWPGCMITNGSASPAQDQAGAVILAGLSPAKSLNLLYGYHVRPKGRSPSQTRAR